MKIDYKYLLLGLLLSLASCDSYLDKLEDNALQLKDVFSKRATTEKYLWNVYSCIPNEMVDDLGSGSIRCAATDEAFYCYASQAATSLNNGAWNVTSAPGDGTWSNMYKGIREANIFIDAMNVKKWCPEDIIGPEEQAMMVNEARFLRAYYYFILMRQYGPIILLGDDVMDITAESSDLYRSRNSWEECLTYVCDELDAVVPLLDEQPQKQWYGKPTKGTALAIKGRLLLYSARDLFNGNSDFREVSDLFSVTKDETKWAKAAAANYEVIKQYDERLYKLVTVTNDEGVVDPYASLYEMVTKEWNSEFIWARRVSWGNIQYASMPGGAGRQTPFGGISPTQEMVDAFAMDNGIYPFTIDGEPSADLNRSGYQDNGFSDFLHPIEGKVTGETHVPNMYVGREARFYSDVFWSGAMFVNGGATPKKWDQLQFYRLGASGIGTNNDYSKGGYMLRKFTSRTQDHTANAYGSWGNITVPMIRLGEVYLNYVEALIESNPTSTDIETYWNRIRTRAGLPGIFTSYPSAKGDKTQMRELIRRERQIELAYEGHRFWDVRMWKLGERLLGKQLHGLNYNITSDAEGSDFWKRTEVESPRIFRYWHNLYPMKQSELDRNKMLIQNPGWK